MYYIVCICLSGAGVYARACAAVLLEGNDQRERESVIQIMMPATEGENT